MKNFKLIGILSIISLFALAPLSPVVHAETKTEDVKTQQIIRNGKVETIIIKNNDKTTNTHNITETHTSAPHISKSGDRLKIKRVVNKQTTWIANSIEDVQANMKAQNINISNIIDGVNYTIQYGDTLSQIAELTNLTIEHIATINQIENPNLIYENDRLLLHK